MAIKEQHCHCGFLFWHGARFHHLWNNHVPHFMIYIFLGRWGRGRPGGLFAQGQTPSWLPHCAPEEFVVTSSCHAITSAPEILVCTSGTGAASNTAVWLCSIRSNFCPSDTWRNLVLRSARFLCASEGDSDQSRNCLNRFLEQISYQAPPSLRGVAPMMVGSSW